MDQLSAQEHMAPSGKPKILSAIQKLRLRPVILAGMVFLLDLAISIFAGAAAKVLIPQMQPDFVATVVLSVVVAVFITVIGWWRKAGFNQPAAWQHLRVLWLPAAVVLALPLLRGVNFVDTSTFIYLTIGYALTGFMEESWFRGIILRILGPLGPTRAVLFTSIFFGLAHSSNFLFRNPFIVLAQMVGAFADGVGMGAIRLRTNTIWFVMIIHAFHDLMLKLTNLPAIPLDVAQDVILFGFGIYLLNQINREQKMAKLAGSPSILPVVNG
jgi:uncharacterized protein